MSQSLNVKEFQVGGVVLLIDVNAAATVAECQQATSDANAAAAAANAAAERAPYIGANGNWFEWDVEAGQYVDTEVSASADVSKADKKQIGYFECDTPAATAAKVVAATGFALPPNGGAIKVKMTYANSAENPTLNINSTGAKPLYYDGAIASADNTWAAGDTLDLYYDGTNWMANNVAGGGVFKGGEKVKEIDITEVPDVMAEAYAQLRQEFLALRDMLTSGKNRGNLLLNDCDVAGERTVVGFPEVLYHETRTGAPSASEVPTNWDESKYGAWNGIPRFVGQRYIDKDGHEYSTKAKLAGSTSDWVARN